MPGLVQRQEDGTVTTGADLIAADPAKYLVADLGATRLNPDTGEYEEVENEYTVEAQILLCIPFQPTTLCSNKLFQRTVI